MKTFICCMLSFMLGLLVAAGMVMSPVQRPTEFGNNVLLPKDDLVMLTTALKESEKENTKKTTELKMIRDKWYNQAGEWVEDLF